MRNHGSRVPGEFDAANRARVEIVDENAGAVAGYDVGLRAVWRKKQSDRVEGSSVQVDVLHGMSHVLWTRTLRRQIQWPDRVRCVGRGNHVYAGAIQG